MRRARRWLLACVLLLVVGAVVLMQLNTQVRTPVGAEGVGSGSHPVVEIAGLGSNGRHYAKLTAALRARGVPVLDFDPATAGVQPLTYRPRDGVRMGRLATGTVAPEIRDALSRSGFARDQVIDVVAHSTGGLLVRYLVEHPVAGWAAQVDDLVMVATPNHGSDVVYWETRRGPMQGLGTDMRPGSAFLDSLGYREPAGEVYTAIGGDPWIFRWLRYGHHGFDDQVPAESPFLTGAALNTFDHLHGHLLRSDEVVSLIVRTLAARG